MPYPYIPMTPTTSPPKGQLGASGGNVAQTRPRVKVFWTTPRCLGASGSHNQSHRGWNLKSEARSPKPETNPKFKAPTLKPAHTGGKAGQALRHVSLPR